MNNRHIECKLWWAAIGVNPIFPKSVDMGRQAIAQSSFDLSGTLAPLTFMLVMGQEHLGWGFWLLGVIQFVGMGLMAKDQFYDASWTNWHEP